MTTFTTRLIVEFETTIDDSGRIVSSKAIKTYPLKEGPQIKKGKKKAQEIAIQESSEEYLS